MIEHFTSSVVVCALLAGPFIQDANSPPDEGSGHAVPAAGVAVTVDARGAAEAAYRRLADRIGSEPVRDGYELHFCRPLIAWNEMVALASGMGEHAEGRRLAYEAYINYLRRVEPQFLSGFPSARARQSEITPATSAGQPLAVVETASELPRVVDRINDMVRAAEQELWQSIEPQLPPEQAWRWERLQYRLAALQSSSRPEDVPGCTIDLSAVLEGSVPWLSDLTGAPSVVREVTLDAWRRGEVLFEARTKTVRKAVGEFCVWRSRGTAGKWAPVKTALAAKIEAETRLLEHNRATCVRLAELLGPEQGSALLARFRANAFPCVYPDPTALEPLAAVLRPILADQAEREVVLKVLEDAAARRLELCDRMERAFIHWRETSRRSDRPPPVWTDYTDEACRLAMQRIAVARQTLNSIRSLTSGTPVATQVQALLDASYDDIRARCSRLVPDPMTPVAFVLRDDYEVEPVRQPEKPPPGAVPAP